MWRWLILVWPLPGLAARDPRQRPASESTLPEKWLAKQREVVSPDQQNLKDEMGT